MVKISGIDINPCAPYNSKDVIIAQINTSSIQDQSVLNLCRLEGL